MTEQDEAKHRSTLGITILTGEDGRDWRKHVPASAIAIGFSTERKDDDQEEEDDESWRGLVAGYGGGPPVTEVTGYLSTVPPGRG